MKKIFHFRLKIILKRELHEYGRSSMLIASITAKSPSTTAHALATCKQSALDAKMIINGIGIMHSKLIQ
jgi:hypothetical protein